MAISVAELVPRGLAAFDACDHDGALALFQQALQLSPAQPDSLMQCGIIHLLRDEFAQAAACFAAVDDCVLPQAPTYHGLALQCAGDAAGARGVLLRARARHAPEALRDTVLAAAQAQLEDGAAARLLGDVVRREPAFSAAALDLGRLRLAVGDAPGAVHALAAAAAALAEDDDVPAVVAGAHAIDLGLALLETQDAAGAIEALTRAVQVLPDLAMAHHALGLALSQLREDEAALAAFAQALAHSPHFEWAHRARGSLFMLRTEYAEAAEAFRHAVACDPTSAHAHVLLGTALLHAGSSQEAAAEHVLARALELDPQNSHARTALDRLRRRNRGRFALVVAEDTELATTVADMLEDSAAGGLPAGHAHVLDGTSFGPSDILAAVSTLVSKHLQENPARSLLVYISASVGMYENEIESQEVDLGVDDDPAHASGAKTTVKSFLLLPGGRLPLAHLYAALALAAPSRVCFLLDGAGLDPLAAAEQLKSLNGHAQLAAQGIYLHALRLEGDGPALPGLLAEAFRGASHCELPTAALLGGLCNECVRFRGSVLADQAVTAANLMLYLHKHLVQNTRVAVGIESVLEDSSQPPDFIISHHIENPPAL